jgi:hypothetical protein
MLHSDIKMFVFSLICSISGYHFAICQQQGGRRAQGCNKRAVAGYRQGEKAAAGGAKTANKLYID